MRTKLLNKLIEQTKRTSHWMIGTKIQKYNLTLEEQRYLVSKGLRVYADRYNERFLIYPQELRIKDLKDKIELKHKNNIIN